MSAIAFDGSDTLPPWPDAEDGDVTAEDVAEQQQRDRSGELTAGAMMPPPPAIAALRAEAIRTNIAAYEQRQGQRRRLAENTLGAAFISAFEYLTPEQVIECLMRASERCNWPRRVRALKSIIEDFEGDPND